MHVQRYKTNIQNCKRKEENQLDATECFIALIICSTCFEHLYAHHQELETILVLLTHMVCIALVSGGRMLSRRAAGYASGMRELVRLECESHKFPCPAALISAIKQSVASSWVSSLRLYYDARTNIHKLYLISTPTNAHT